MACKIDYDKNGKINKVYDQNGQASKLFTSIAKLPHMNTLEEALEVYKNTFTKKFYSLMGERGAKNRPEILTKLDRAKTLESEGASEVLIEKETGWFKENNQWKFLDTETLKNFKLNEDSVNIREPQKLKNVITNETLFKTFPFLAESEIQFEKDLPIKTAAFNPKTKTIRVGISTSRLKGEDNLSSKRLDSIVSSIVHEIQHYIQYYEGFPTGGNQQTAIREQAKKIGIPTFTDPFVFINAANNYLKSNGDVNVKEALDAVIEYTNSKNTDGLNSLYSRVFGEVEARLMQDLRDKLLNGESFEGVSYSELKDDMLRREGIESNLFTVYAEPNLNFKSSLGNNFTTYREALLDSTGGDIEISIGDIPVLYVSSNTNTSELGGFINNNIKAGILSDERIVEQGESFLKAEGYDAVRQIVNEIQIKDDSIFSLGSDSITVHKDGRIELKEKPKTIEIEGKELNRESVQKMTFPQLKEVISEDAAITTSIQNTIKDTFSRVAPKEKVLSEESLKLKLLDVLNKMGVKVMSMSNYIENYNIKTGVDPSASALADIANQVIAFKNNEISIEDLSEETAHFIVETWDAVEIENVLRNIHKTESYVEFAEQYREIYTRENPSMSEQEIDNLVRKEILGKELASALQTGFNTENKTEIQKNIWQKLYDLFVKFFTGVNDDVKVVSDLEALTEKVEDLVFTQNVSSYLNLGNLKTKKFRMYSTKSGNTSVDSLRNLANRTVASLLEQEKSLRSAKKGSQANVEQFKDLQRQLNNEMEDALLAKSVSDVLALVKRQAKYVNDALTVSNKKGETLTNEESMVLHSLTNQTVPMLAQMKDMINSLNSGIFNNLKTTIGTVNEEITALKGKLANTENDILERVVDRVMARHLMPEKTYNDDGTVKRDVRGEIMAAIKEAKKDTNMLFAYYGQLTHASDPLLQLLGSVIFDIFTNAEQSHLNRAKTLQDQMSKKGFKAADAKEFIKGKWLLSLWDFDAYEKEEARIKAEVLAKISGKSKEELLDKDKFLSTLEALTPEQNTEYQTEAASLLKKEKENDFEDEYYEKREKELKDLGISTVTTSALRKLSVARGEVMSKTTVEGGKPRYTLQNKYDLDFLNIKRKNMKSIFDIDGTLKVGIIQDEDGKVEFEGIKYSLIEGASDEGTIAYEMQIIDKNYIDQLKKKEGDVEEGLAKSFEEELAKITDQEEAREFFLMNTNIGFANSFWDTFDKTDTFISRIEKFSSDKGGKLDSKVAQYKEKVSNRNNILKRYKDSRNATNTLAEEMSDDLRDKVISLSEEIDEIARTFTSQKDFPKSESEVEAESTPNEAYYGKLNDDNLTTDEEKLRFAMKHMTSSNLKKVREVNDAFSNLIKGRVLTTTEQKAVERAIKLKLEDVDVNAASKYKLDFAESRLASYYRAFAPTGLSQAMRQLENGEKSVVEIVEDLKNNPDVKLTNHYSYYEKSEIENRNENKIRDFAGGYTQPRLSKYLNKDFVKMFAPKTENGQIIFDENGDIIPTINEKKYEFYKLMMDYHKETLKSYGEYGRHNAYLAPQVTKQAFETIEDFAKKRNKGASVREWWENISQYRADELATGAEVNGKSLFKGSNIKVIPKYFLNRLKEGEEPSQDLFYTMTAMAQQSELYKSRLENFHEVAVLQDSIVNREYPNGKKAETTSTYKMAESYINGAIFGVREIRDARVSLPFFGEVNLTKIIDTLHKFRQNQSLAFNVVIPATSLLTANTSLWMEPYIGQYLDLDSYKKAKKELNKLGMSSFNEAFNIDSKSKMSVMGEYFGVFDLDNKFKNSAYSRSSRFLGRMGYILHTAANYTPISRALLSSLYGHRLYNNQFVDFNQFKTLQKKSGKDKKTIDADWNSLENKTLYNYIKIDEATNTMTYEYEQIAKDMGVEYNEQFLSDFRNRELGITAKTRKLVELIDGNIPQSERTLLQRDVLGRFVMTHSSWLSIALARRFKTRQDSFQTGLEEEGTYVSLGKFLTRALGGITKDGVKSFTEAYKSADDVEKANLIRILKEAGFLQGLYLLSLGLGAFADDDKNKDIYALQAASFLADRTVNETSSSQLGVVGELYQKLQSPIVGLKQVKDLLTIKQAFDFDKIEKGSYRGLTNSQAYMIKQIPGLKVYRDFQTGENLKKARDTYNFYANQPDFILANYLVDKESLE